MERLCYVIRLTPSWGVEGLFSMRKSQTVLALYFVGASMSALAAVNELPADGSTVVEFAYVDGKLLLEVHPPVDGEGQVAEVDPEAMSQKLRAVLGQDTAVIHWDFARKALVSRVPRAQLKDA